MKLRVVLVCLVALGLSASVAIAAPPPGKGKPASPGNSANAGKPLPTGPTCKPKVTVVLKGTLTSSRRHLGWNRHAREPMGSGIRACRHCDGHRHRCHEGERKRRERGRRPGAD